MLKVGDKAPDFTLPSSSGEKVSMSDFIGKKTIIYFYPKDDTPGCTKQACAFRNAYDEFKNNDVNVVGISKDSTESHEKFAKKYELPFTLLADKDSVAINGFGVKGMLGATRTTFIIDENLNIEKIFEKATPDTNASEILEYLKSKQK